MAYSEIARWHPDEYSQITHDAVPAEYYDPEKKAQEDALIAGAYQQQIELDEEDLDAITGGYE
jgi:hypothetical protein